MEITLYSILVSITFVGVIASVSALLNWVWVKPKNLEKLLRQQGLKGSRYRLLTGDVIDFLSITKAEQAKAIQFSDNLPAHILPYYHHAMAKYGGNCFIWFGPWPTLIISEPELLKEILTNPNVYQKPVPNPIGEMVVGGLALLEDEKWAKHRKIIHPAFHMDKLKSMVPAMTLSCSNMIEKWETLFSDQSSKDLTRKIDVWPYLENLTADVISRTAFGSSHEQGRKVFELQKEQLNLISELMFLTFFPGLRFIPTKAMRRMKEISKEIQALLMDSIKEREKAMAMGKAFGDDLLGTLMESSMEVQRHGDVGLSIKDIIEECKLFYLAGSETTSVLLVWTMVMLSVHQEWQARAREEVLHVFGSSQPNFDGLSRLKIVTMILQEVLRLYPPASLMLRRPTKATKLGNITIPIGVDLTLLIGMLHHDPTIWGNDVKEFKPERFSEGIANATSGGSFSYIPFSSGPRSCIGQHYSMIESKITLSMLLQHFSFELSKSYVHAPFTTFTVRPQKGASLFLRRL